MICGEGLNDESAGGSGEGWMDGGVGRLACLLYGMLPLDSG